MEEILHSYLSARFPGARRVAVEGLRDATRLLTGVRAYIQLRIERDMAGIFAMEGGMAGRG